MEHKDRMLKHAQDVFNLRVEKDRKWARSIGLRKTAGKGSQGPFYWLKLGGKTILKAMPYPADALETMDHPDFWSAIIDSDVVPFYKITDPKIIQELKNVPYAMPRGRVVLVARPIDRVKQFMVWHWEKMTDGQKKQIIEAFDLSAQFYAGLVRFASDEHEGQIADDQARFNALLPKRK